MNGTIARVIGDKGFGFVRDTTGVEHFFHKTGFNGHWDDLVYDHDKGVKIPVEFDQEHSSKGPRATNVTRTDHPNQG